MNMHMPRGLGHYVFLPKKSTLNEEPDGNSRDVISVDEYLFVCTSQT